VELGRSLKMNGETERQREHFNSIATRYYKARRHQNHLLLKDLMWQEFLSHRQELKVDGLRVLEPMCGFADGKDILEKTLGVSVVYTGFDYSESVVSKLRKIHPDLRVTRENIEAYRSEELFDIIILIGGLHHVPHAASQVLKNLATNLKPGGHFINLEPTSGNYLFSKIRDVIYKRNHLFDQLTERAFGIEELFTMFRNSGLREVDTMYPGLLSYILYYNPDAFPWLNVGGSKMVQATFWFDCLLIRTLLAKTLSFATLSLWRKETNLV
jgi:SAM-dependent methyltransferase